MPPDIESQEENIIKQLVWIYQNLEFWHATRMSYQEALNYHREHLKNGDIYVHVEDGKVLAYYERYITGNICVAFNIFVAPSARQGIVFRKLYRHFFDTLPLHVERVEGERQKYGGIIRKYNLIRRK